METLLGALWWIIKAVWGLVWLLIGGWVSAALQIVVLVLAVFAYKYGWRRAPYEAWRGVKTVGRWGWAWLRGAQALSAGGEPRVREVEVIRKVHVKDFGDVNVSTLLNVMMLVGLALMGLAR
jgi:hypothetical protein